MIFPPEYLGLFFCIPLVAFLYASVGHGGASGYIALMYLFSFSEISIKPVALTINLFVAGIAFYHFRKQGYFRMNLFLYFAIGSIPLSFVGGLLKISPLVYNSLLAIFLVFAIVKLSGLLSSEIISKKMVKINPLTAISIGALIGFLSGLIGIGGGIILTPVLLLLGWANIKEAAAISALFIWVNSAAALGGQLAQGINIPNITWSLLLLAAFGGFFGSYIGASKVSEKIVKGLLILVLTIAFGKLVASIWIAA